MTIQIDPKEVKPGPPPPLDVLDKHSNHAFFVRFGLVVLLLHVVGGGLVLAARVVGHQEPDESLRRELIEERIAPIGQVATTQEQLEALSPVEAPVSPRSGEQVVQQVCAGCHASGLLDAPKIHDTPTWQARAKAAGGPDSLVENAIRGKGQMPPRGGQPDLSDQEISDAIEAML